MNKFELAYNEIVRSLKTNCDLFLRRDTTHVRTLLEALEIAGGIDICDGLEIMEYIENNRTDELTKEEIEFLLFFMLFDITTNNFLMTKSEFIKAAGLEDDIGKTVFLTKEEAERALAERGCDDDT